ncbi:MAG: division/cell wall cluster transcriptional repressor MraZ [Lachnospiraceae bacterium]
MEMGDLLASLGIDMMFGRSNLSLDSKGRITIPVDFRQSLDKDGNGVVITHGYNVNCLNVYSVAEFIEQVKELQKIPPSDEEGQKFIRYFAGSAERCFLDKQGKVLIPQELRQDVDLGKDVLISGMGKHAEIWNRETWKQMSSYETTAQVSASVEKYQKA